MLDLIIFIILILVAIFCLLSFFGSLFLDNDEYDRSAKIIAALFFLIVGFILPIFLGFNNCDTGRKIIEWKFGPKAQLEKQVEELNEISNNLRKKKKEVNSLRVEYRQDITFLKNEIRSEKRKHKIKTYQQAKNNSRISYDLALIQRKIAYINKLDKIFLRIQFGALELEYLQRRAEDDLKMQKVMDEQEIKQLYNDINVCIEKYLPEINKLAIEIDDKSLPSQKEIWQDIIKNN
jgi:hypothetical protein